MSEPLWVPIGAVAAVGDELAYAQATANVTVTATTEAAAQTIATLPAITVDGATPVIINVHIPFVSLSVGGYAFAVLYDGSTSLGRFGGAYDSATGGGGSYHGSMRLTPAAGSHAYSLRVYVSGGTGTLYAGTGGVGQYSPAFIRVSSVRPTGVGAGGGGVLAHKELTANTSFVGLALTPIITADPVTFDGTTAVLVEFSSLAVVLPNVAACFAVIALFVDGVQAASMAFIQNPGGGASIAAPVRVSQRITPAAGSRTFSIRAQMGAAGQTGTVQAGLGGATQNVPAYLRIVRDQ